MKAHTTEELQQFMIQLLETSAKGKLEEAFYTIPSIYNLTTFKEFVESIHTEPSYE